jgi:hypothetical protein
MNMTHRQTWQSHLIFCAAQLAFAYPFALVFLYIFSWELLPLVVISLILLGGTVLCGSEIYDAITKRRDFLCAIDRGRIRCECPSESTGSSFDLAIAELACIEINDDRVTLLTKTGEKYWLTSNYGNPAGRFVRALVKVNPDVEVNRL